MNASEARTTLEEIGRLRRRAHRAARGRPDGLWFPFLLFGPLMLATPFVERAAGGEAVGILWAVAGPLGGVACAAFFHRREVRIGLEIPPAPYLAVAVAIVAGALLLGWAGGVSGSRLAWLGPLLVVSAGYGLYAWLDRMPLLGALAATLAIVVVVVAASDLADRTASLVAGLVYGGGFVLTGLVLLARGRRA